MEAEVSRHHQLRNRFEEFESIIATIGLSISKKIKARLGKTKKPPGDGHAIYR